MINFVIEGEVIGPLKPGMRIAIPDGYVVLTGENDVGKTALLHTIFRYLYSQDKQDRICFIPKYREFILGGITSDQSNLRSINGQIARDFNQFRLQHEAYQSYWPSLFSVLVKEFDIGSQSLETKSIISNLGLGNYRNGSGGVNILDEIPLSSHGSGVRSIMPIIAALTCPTIEYIIIDEPESGLEAGRQKQLKRLFQEIAKENSKIQKNIIVVTHSHLFLNEKFPENNIKVLRNSEEIELSSCKNIQDLSRIAFNMLGSSLSDLYLPDNYLLVEGASDQVLVQKVFELINSTENRERQLRVLTCNGMENIEPTLQSVHSVFMPIIEGKSPYANLSVALMDKPSSEQTRKIAEELKKILKRSERYFELTEESLEKYLPEEFYNRAEMNKEEFLKKIDEQRSYREKSKIKKEISTRVAQVLTYEDLGKISEIKNAVTKALEV